MKVVKKVVAVALVLTMVLSLAGCSKKATDKKTFKAAVEKCDYDDDNVDEYDPDDKDIKKAFRFHEDDIYAYLVIFKDKDDAKDYVDDYYDDAKDDVDDGDFEGSVKKSGLFTKKITINGEFDESDREFYGVMIQDGTTVVWVYTYDNGKSAVKDVNALVKAMGY